MAPAVLVIVTVASGGCGFRLGYEELLPLCGSETCPDEEAPDAGDGPPDAMPGPDVDAGDGTPLAVPCGSLFLLRDDFADGVQSGLWVQTADTDVTVRETDGHLAIDLGAGTANVAGQYRSRVSYDLRSSALTATVARTAGQATAIEIRDADRRGAAISVRGDALVAVSFDGDAESVHVAMVYDPLRHARWRLRESGGRLFWETSADGQAWALVHSAPLPLADSYVFATLRAAGQVAGGGEAWFDDVNLPRTTSPGPCKASTFRDAFDGSLREYNRWSTAPSCSGRVSGGYLELAFGGTGDAWCGAETNRLFDLRDDSVAVEVVTPSVTRRMLALFEVRSIEPDAELEMLVEADVLYMSVFRDGAALARVSTVFNATADRHWRIREQAGTTYFETSPDRASWTVKHSAPTAVDVSSVQLDLAAGHPSPGPGTPQTIRYDNLNP